MALAEIRHRQRLLEKKFGVRGIVAGLYVEAGYSVRLGVRTPVGDLDIVAQKGGEKLGLRVVEGSIVVGEGLVESLVKAAESIGAKPVLVLYGGGPRLSGEALKLVREKGVKVRRVRPS